MVTYETTIKELRTSKEEESRGLKAVIGHLESEIEGLSGDIAEAEGDLKETREKLRRVENDFEAKLGDRETHYEEELARMEGEFEVEKKGLEKDLILAKTENAELKMEVDKLILKYRQMEKRLVGED